MSIPIAQFGLGPIGLATLRLAATKPWAEIVGAVDIDPAKYHQDLGELSGVAKLRGRRVCRSLDELLAVARPDVMLHTSVSRLQQAFTQIEPIVQQGINVVSSCEELVYPQLREPRLSAQLDELCQQRQARVVGTGVNPGFVMDVLPLCLTGICCDLRAIHVQRVVNASTRRGPLQKKIGSGRPPEEFSRLLQRGEAGHAGLRESLELIAHVLGWKLEDVRETAEVIIADHTIRTDHFEVQPGQTCGIHQRAEARMSGKPCLTLDIKMYLDAENPHDAIQVDGEPPLDVLIKGGVAGDQATVATLVNTTQRLLQARPGLLLLSDLPLPRLA